MFLKKTIALFYIIFFYTSCASVEKNGDYCNFSPERSEPERCFHGIGDRCKGVPILAPIHLNFDYCTAFGYMSIGSILHDQCCDKNKNGYRCAFPDKNTSLCLSEWNEAVRDTFCSTIGASRQWKVTFGPYYKDNKGDNLYLKSNAPSGQRVDIKHIAYCKNGCQTNEKGIIITKQDFCGQYCICQ